MATDILSYNFELFVVDRLTSILSLCQEIHLQFKGFFGHAEPHETPENTCYFGRDLIA
jgi:hypothetical protein